ncbi:hypothetical protein Q7P37_008785 [Cladosporium fusiforme]
MPWHWPRSSLHEVQAGGDPLSLDVLGVHHAEDGGNVELVHVRFSQNTASDPLEMNIMHRGDVPTPEDVKDKVDKLKTDGPTSLRQLNATNKLIGNCTAKAIKQFAKEQHFSLDDDIDLVGSSGCLIKEEPQPDDGSSPNDASASEDQESTELGDISIVAAKTNKTTVGTFQSSARASGLSPDSVSHSFDSLLEGQMDEDGVIEAAKAPLGIAFATFEGCVGRPLSSPEDDENERMALVGQVQSGDNFFEVRKKVGKFWGECPDDMVGPTRQLILECEC